MLLQVVKFKAIMQRKHQCRGMSLVVVLVVVDKIRDTKTQIPVVDHPPPMRRF
jgi:hypothetical protein